VSGVVVTGVGLLGGCGGLDETGAALAAGSSALRPVELADACGLPALAGAPAAAAELAHLRDRKLAKYMSPAARMATVAAGRALADAGLLGDAERCAGLALHVATGLIAFDLSAVQSAMLASRSERGELDLARMGESGFRLCNPLLPFKMLLNTPLGLISIVYGIRGENFILYPDATQGGACVEAALRALRCGRAARALVGGVSHALSLLPLCTQLRLGRAASSAAAAQPFSEQHAGCAQADVAAFVVLEREDAARERGARVQAWLEAASCARAHGDRGARAAWRARRSAWEALRCPAPGLVISTGNLDRADDADELATAGGSVVRSFDGALGFAGPAALPQALALGVRTLARGSRLLVSALDADGGCAAALLGSAPTVATPLREARRVVVTGLGVVSPIGSGRAAFFAGLREARSGVDLIRSFDARGFATRIAGEVRDLPLTAHELPPAARAALERDAKARYGLCAAREALASAFGERAPGELVPAARIAAFVAAGLEIFNLEDLVAHVRAGDGAFVDGAAVLGEVMAAPALARLQIPADLAARCIAREAGAGGLYALNLSACAAGTQAIGEAFRAIREGAAEIAIAGGYDSMVNPLGVGGFCLLEALSRANELRGAASRPFDARRDGFVLGEGAAFVVLEERDLARRRGAEPLAEILGYASTLDAYRMTDPAPDGAGAIAALRGALADAGLAPHAVDYVSAHGTGTRKNDPAESAAIRAVFGAHADRLPVSSTKSQIGHLIGAAGAVELAATLWALREQTLPATINLEQPDPECDLDYVPLRPRPARVRVALKSSFGFGGQNACLVVGEP
jgi:3-oxoacyl-[acyl-carrier-protein] synthase II